MATELYKSGGFATDTITDIVNLWGVVSLAGNWSTFREVGATSSYQVPGGKLFYATKILIYLNDDQDVTSGVSLGVGSDVGLDSGVSPTGVTDLIGTTTGVAANDSGFLFVPLHSTPFLDTHIEVTRFKNTSSGYLHFRLTGSTSYITTVLMSGFAL